MELKVPGSNPALYTFFFPSVFLFFVFVLFCLLIILLCYCCFLNIYLPEQM